MQWGSPIDTLYIDVCIKLPDQKLYYVFESFMCCVMQCSPPIILHIARVNINQTWLCLHYIHHFSHFPIFASSPKFLFTSLLLLLLSHPWFFSGMLPIATVNEVAMVSLVSYMLHLLVRLRESGWWLEVQGLRWQLSNYRIFLHGGPEVHESGFERFLVVTQAGFGFRLRVLRQLGGY